MISQQITFKGSNVIFKFTGNEDKTCMLLKEVDVAEVDDDTCSDSRERSFIK